MTGICEYCGQVVEVGDQAVPDEAAWQFCGCPDARRRRKLARKIAKAMEHVDELCGPEAEDYGMQPVQSHSAVGLLKDAVAEIGSGGHTYVMTEDDTIVGTGTVITTGEAECEIIAAFLLPEAIGRGLGRQLFAALEADELCVKARRIWLTSSVNALDFYEKTGWQYVYGYRQRGGEMHLLEMEKRK